MKHNANSPGLISRSAFVQLLAALFVLLFSALVLSGLALLAGRLFFGEWLSNISFQGELSPEQLAYLKFAQALQHISFFVIPPLLVAWLMTGQVFRYFGMHIFPGYTALLLVIILALALLPLTGDLGVLNSGLKLPEWLSGLESWIQSKEDEAANLTAWLIESGNTRSLLVNIFILALLPAVGEELLYRGVLQQIFEKLFRSAHLSVLVTAVLFSASHLQFYGFLPRFLLGLVYGYLFYWSRSIWLPVLAHFVNNLVPVILARAFGWETLNSKVRDLAGGEGYTWIIPLLLSLVLMYAVRDIFRNPGYSER